MEDVLQIVRIDLPPQKPQRRETNRSLAKKRCLTLRGFKRVIMFSLPQTQFIRGIVSKPPLHLSSKSREINEKWKIQTELFRIQSTTRIRCER
jgi:hypothetical protein